MIAFVIVVSLLLFIVTIVYGLYRCVFCHPRKKRPDVRYIPDSNLYRTYKDQMLEVVDEMEKTSWEEVSIFSLEGLRLFGKLYLTDTIQCPSEEMGRVYDQRVCNMKKNAPLIIFFHGYHGLDAWDGYGFFKLCRKNGFHLLMVDERAHGKSGGNVITFGIKERYDCKVWAEYAAKRFGEDTHIFLAGVSMGAASVIMSSELGLPENVKAIIADCGYSEPGAIIKETIRTMKLPVKPIYQLIKLGAHLFGRFDLEEAAALHAIERLDIPILFIHGSQDSIVPPAMGEALYEACKAKKERVLIEGADHANSAMTDYGTYEKAILQFLLSVGFARL